MHTITCTLCPWTVTHHVMNEEEDALMDFEDHMNQKHGDPAAGEVNPWETPEGWWSIPIAEREALEAVPAPPTRCGRCESEEGPEGLMYHLEWKCTAKTGWIVAAINDRRYRPDRYRQAKKDLGVKTLKEAREALKQH